MNNEMRKVAFASGRKRVVVSIGALAKADDQSPAEEVALLLDDGSSVILTRSQQEAIARSIASHTPPPK